MSVFSARKTEVETRTRRSQERKEPYPELLNVLQRSPSDTSNSVTLRELWQKAANISENEQTEGPSIFMLCVSDMQDKWYKLNAQEQTYLTVFTERIHRLRHAQVLNYINSPRQRHRFYGLRADHRCDNLSPEELVRRVRTLVPITRVYTKNWGDHAQKGIFFEAEHGVPNLNLARPHLTVGLLRRWTKRVAWNAKLPSRSKADVRDRCGR